MISSIVIVFGAQQSDSIICIYNSLHLLISNSQPIRPSVTPTLATTSLFSVCDSVSVLYMSSFVSYFRLRMMWYHMVFIFLWLHLVWFSLSVYPCCCKWCYFILCVWVIFHSECMCMYVCVCIYIYTHKHHVFLIHSSVNGHLVCFHVLAVVNSAAVNIGLHVSFWIMVLSGYMPQE